MTEMRFKPAINDTFRNSKFVPLSKLVVRVVAFLVTAFICATQILAAEYVQSDSTGIETKRVELRNSVTAAATPERTRELLSEVLSLIDESLAIDEYTLAIRVANLAVCSTQ